MSKSLTKAELINELASRAGTEKKAATAIIEALSGLIHDQVAAGGAVTIPEVGKIYCRERSARTVRNPSTGEAIEKDADRAVKMTFAKMIKDKVNA
ncbi:HU family DNA-binding protein [Paracoccus aestuariivivens]|uniref:HU family DNA-binding protein n=1 Tax=Paracoccus aestuariivivens TaxID=1820333 RepID=A0A6L6JHE8_9RHOB|nr:HU family DNA-binding protein [Paracoccus aestuariivivens]MTH79564.1 HU family DNA-binding protein [Paracoccus aestuariivivens]